ncbi:aquaporin [Mycoplasma sp. AC1221]
MDKTCNSPKPSVFSFFKLRRKNRTSAERPKDIKSWIIHGFSEFFGTLLLTLLLAGLSTNITVVKGQGSPLTIENFLLHPIVVGFYVGFIAVGLVLFIFNRWSSDLNPAVSMYRYLCGSQTGWYVSYKIFMQMLAAIVAGAIIFAVGKATTEHHIGYLSNQPWNTITATKKAYYFFRGDWTPNYAMLSGSIWIFFIELIMTAILLFPIFSPNINDKYRDILIMFIISLAVWMGLLGGSVAINPFRGLAQQLPVLAFENNIASDGYLQIKNTLQGYDVIKDATNSVSAAVVSVYRNSVISATISMMLGGLFAPAFYMFMQGLTARWFNPCVLKIIGFKNKKAECMEKCEESNQNGKIEHK